MMCLVLAGVIAGCAPEVLPVAPPAAPFVLPTLIPPTPIPLTPTATATPTLVPVTATPTAATRGPTARTSPTVVTLTATPSRVAMPTSAIPPGVYVIDLRTDPPAVRGPDLKFFATFLNAMSKEQTYRWEVYVFRADTQKGFGETTRTDSAIPAGTVERQSNGTWKLPAGACEFFYAQVGWFNAENKITWFTTPSGAVFQKTLTMCPP
jgi:hypothetical protein